MSTASRGYGAGHQRVRKAFQPLVAAGLVSCWRCGQPILRTDEWDLGHDDRDRSRYRGPEHRSCNRGKNGRPVIDMTDYPEDDPENGIYWGPPDFQTGRPTRWSRPWTNWREDAAHSS
jgi:hypothetical protein